MPTQSMTAVISRIVDTTIWPRNDLGAQRRSRPRRPNGRVLQGWSLTLTVNPTPRTVWSRTGEFTSASLVRIRRT